MAVILITSCDTLLQYNVEYGGPLTIGSVYSMTFTGGTGDWFVGGASDTTDASGQASNEQKVGYFKTLLTITNKEENEVFLGKSVSQQKTVSVAAFGALPLLDLLVVFLASALFNINSLKSTNSMKHISALSPKRLPNLIIRVYPPGRFATFSETIENNSLIASLFCK